MNTSKKPVAVYARVSTEDQNLDSQLTACRDWCGRSGMESVEYLDKISGSSVSRHSLDRMMADIRSGKVSTVVCYKLDRLGRSLVHLAQMIGEFDSLGVSLVCPSQGIDTRKENPSGRLQMHILMAVAEFERSLIKERTKAGLAATKARGTRLGRPEGHGKKMRVAIIKAKALKEHNGWSNRRISRELNISEASVRRALAA